MHREHNDLQDLRKTGVLERPFALPVPVLSQTLAGQVTGPSTFCSECPGQKRELRLLQQRFEVLAARLEELHSLVRLHGLGTDNEVDEPVKVGYEGRQCFWDFYAQTGEKREKVSDSSE
jgi:hypothetical protein